MKSRDRSSRTNKSLSDKDPMREKPYAHVISVNANPVNGQLNIKRASHHKNKNNKFSIEDWVNAYNQAIFSFAEKEASKETSEKKEKECDTDQHLSEQYLAEQWLKEREIVLADLRTITNRKDIKLFLNQEGPKAFTLGIHLPGLKGETIASPRELPRIENNVDSGNPAISKSILTKFEEELIASRFGNVSSWKHARKSIKKAYEDNKCVIEAIDNMDDNQLDDLLIKAVTKIGTGLKNLPRKDQQSLGEWADIVKSDLLTHRIKTSTESSIGRLNIRKSFKSNLVIPNYVNSFWELIGEIRLCQINRRGLI